MGRRSFISMTAIKQLMSASRQCKRERERENLINSQNGIQKELSPTYTIQKVDFNLDTRIAKIEIVQSQKYRTIERYVTQNYQRYPIYSDLKTKTKVLKKTLKLTNTELENLDNNSDFLIRKFSEEIICKLNNEDLLPSWFLRSINLKQYKQKVDSLNSKHNELIKEFKAKIYNYNQLIEQKTKEKEEQLKTLDRKNLKLTTLQKKILKIKNSKRNIFKIIFTFCIYALLISNHRISRLSTKEQKLLCEINKSNENIENINNLISTNQNEIILLKDQIVLKEEKLKKEIAKEYRELKKKQDAITPLICEINDNSEFISLKSLNGLEYKKIIGCYVIHNKENNKYYVGQSKDVIKRVKQHFKGTIPNNVIFAEDYYSTLPENRDDLFEVKIFPFETKDELDLNEKSLIEKYDAFNNGYNGTNGNT